MKISKETLSHFSVNYPLEEIAPLENILFLDIETTGFTAKTSFLYLIGCAYYQEGNWQIIQWMANDYEQEASLLNAFFEFSKNFTHLFHYNGSRFDLPYLLQKCAQHGITETFSRFQEVDLYQRLSPYRILLKLPNCRQKTLENFLEIKRDDPFSGRELIDMYHDYVASPSPLTEQALLLHNADDLRGMLDLLPSFAYPDLLQKPLKAKKVQANYYRDFQGNQRKELLITVVLPTALPKAITASANGCYFRGEGNEGAIKVPIYEEELKYFYSNYKDYYYLPEEDLALHKSVATFVDKQYRTQASATNCYTRKFSDYLPQWDIVFEPFFMREYHGKELFFELTDSLKRDRDAFGRYASHLLQMIVSTY